MLTEERHQKILHLLTTQHIVKSQELAELLQASESTIRRDLKELEEQNKLVRIHGGAKQLQDLHMEESWSEKTAKNQSAKKAIAAFAASFIQPKDIIYLDAGSTTFELIPYLSEKELTVVTNSVLHAAQLMNEQIHTIILGGELKLTTKAVIGTTCLTQLQNLRVNKAFIGMNNIHAQGFFTPDPEEAALKRTAMAQAQESFVMADHTKLDTLSFVKVAALQEATLIVDKCPAALQSVFQSKTTLLEACT